MIFSFVTPFAFPDATRGVGGGRVGGLRLVNRLVDLVVRGMVEVMLAVLGVAAVSLIRAFTLKSRFGTVAIAFARATRTELTFEVDGCGSSGEGGFWAIALPNEDGGTETVLVRFLVIFSRADIAFRLI